jgi:hypothetical protein
MKYLLGFVFGFFWIFVLAGNHQNPVIADDNKGNLNATYHSTVPFANDGSSPELLVDVKISGKVFHTGTGTLPPFAGVTITFSNLGTVITNDTGYYEKFVPSQWTGTVTPYYCGFYDFSPASRTYTKIKVNTPNQDFVGTPNPPGFSINGTITSTTNNQPIPNLILDFGGG